MRKLISILAIAAFAAACAAPATTPSPIPASPTPSASIAPSAPVVSASPSSPATPIASASPSPTASPSPATAAAPLEIDWTQLKATGLEGLDPAYSIDTATINGRIVVIGTRSHTDADGGTQSYPAIWWSDDGKAWKLAELPSGLAEKENAALRDVTTWDRGFVAVGEDSGYEDSNPMVLTSPDGRTWAQVRDSSLVNGGMRQVGATESGLVAFGSSCCPYSDGGAIWTSADGKDWLRATNDTGLHVAKGIGALVQHDGSVTAFVQAKTGVEVWSTSGRAEWKRLAVLTGEKGVDSAAAGPLGWFASGDVATWTSSDGMTWRSTKATAYGGSAVVADAAGFIGTRPELFESNGCAEPWPNFYRGETWTSLDGRKWLRLPRDPALEKATIMSLVVVDRTLFGIGGSYRNAKNMEVLPAVWSAELPAIATASVQGDLPKPGPAGQGCGP